MTHLAPGTRLPLAIEVQNRSRLARQFETARHLLPKEIGHFDIGMADGCRKGPAGDGADMKIELGEVAGILGPMARIVQARGDLIDEKPLLPLQAQHEHLDRHDADITEGLGKA
jgi:hypothetical protein